MPNILWEIPVPPSALLEGGPTFAIEGRKVRIALCFEHEADGPDRRVTLRFTDVEVFACTYMHALEMRQRDAYGAVVDCGATEWLEGIATRVAARGKARDGLRHLMITFDDGPCWEIACRGFACLEGALDSVPSGLVFGKANHPSRVSFARLDHPLESLSVLARALFDGETAEFWATLDDLGGDLLVIGVEHIEGGATPLWCLDASTGVIVTMDLEADELERHHVNSSVAHLQATIAAFRDWRALGGGARFADLRATLEQIEGDAWVNCRWRDLLEVLEDGTESEVVFEVRATVLREHLLSIPRSARNAE